MTVSARKFDLFELEGINGILADDDTGFDSLDVNLVYLEFAETKDMVLRIVIAGQHLLLDFDTPEQATSAKTMLWLKAGHC